MKVFKLHPGPVCEWALTDDASDTLALTTTGEALSDTWEPVAVHGQVFEDEGSGASPRVPMDLLWIGSHGLVVRKRGKAFFESLANTGVVEFLPLRSDLGGDELWLLNCLKICDAFDADNADVVRFPTGKILTINRHAFNSDAITDPIFRIPELRPSPVFLVESLADLLLTSGLVGIEMLEVFDG